MIQKIGTFPAQTPVVNSDGTMTAEWQRFLTDLITIINELVDKVNTLP